MTDEIRLEQDDVMIEEVIEGCSECTTTITGSSFVVMIDFRSAGMTTPLSDARYCHRCAQMIAERIRASLPAKACRAGAQ